VTAAPSGAGQTLSGQQAHQATDRHHPPSASVGSYGWSGIYGTGWYNDPAEDMTTVLMIQRAPAPPGLPILLDFWTAAYQAIDD
jgi:CubicO group peptidase (beta-lactamase class C family)